MSGLVQVKGRRRSTIRQYAAGNLNFQRLLVAGARASLGRVMREVCPATGRHHLSDTLDGVVRVLNTYIDERAKQWNFQRRPKSIHL